MTPRPDTRPGLLRTAIACLLFTHGAAFVLGTQPGPGEADGYARGQAEARLQIAREIATAEAAGGTYNSRAEVTEYDVNYSCALPVWLPDTVARWRDGICEHAAAHGIDPALLAIVITVESGGWPEATSGVAYGLAQIHPPTWSKVGFDASRAYEPAYSIEWGAYVLADCLSRYGVRDDLDWQQSVDRAAACFNGGSPTNGTAETTRYRWYVSGMWAERHDDHSPTLERWLDAGGERLVAAAIDSTRSSEKGETR